MTKTIDDWREEINELFLKSSNEALKLINNMQTEIIIAFCAKYNLQPNEVVLCYQGNKFWVEKREV